MAFITILGLIPTATLFVPLLRKPKELLTRKFWKDARRGVNLIFSPKDGVFGSTIGQILITYVQTSIQMIMTRPNIWSTTKEIT